MASSLVGAIMRATGDRRLEYWFQFLSRKSSTGSPKARVLPEDYISFDIDLLFDL
jgi:hypothetical protein